MRLESAAIHSGSESRYLHQQEFASHGLVSNLIGEPVGDWPKKF